MAQVDLVYACRTCREIFRQNRNIGPLASEQRTVAFAAATNICDEISTSYDKVPHMCEDGPSVGIADLIGVE